MNAIAITPGTPGTHLVERPEPAVTATNDIKLRVLSVGICGTDREEVGGGRADAPDGAQELVIGHEMLGQVIEIGTAVTRVTVGDHAVFTVRRGCGACLSCRVGRSDMCQTGKYRERGIKGLDGYQTELVVDRDEHVVRVPPELASIAVLTEPLSIVEKAIDTAQRVQIARAPEAAVAADWLVGRRAMVAGLGPVGLLAAMVLALRGAEVYGLDVVDAGSTRPQWLQAIGGRYIDGRTVPATRVAAAVAPMDLIVEAAGIARLEFNLLDALALNGLCVLTGIPGGDRPLQIPGAEIVRRLVLGNQVLLGSVNAARGHFEMAVRDLAHAELRWPGQVARLIHHTPVADAAHALANTEAGTIKDVIDWTGR